MINAMQYVITMTVLMAIIRGLQSADEDSLNLTPYRRGETNGCVTKDNRTGICVDESICSQEHTIEPGGIIEDSDYRLKRPCSKREDWCCSTEKLILHPKVGTTKTAKCLPLDSDVCPWCVVLYTAVEKETPHNVCLGALIGSQVILTSASCVTVAHRKKLYARVPNSATPMKYYNVTRRTRHPNYNTGTHEYDFGILVLENKVVFKSGDTRGACLDFLTPFEGECLGYGFDYHGNIVSTFLTVEENGCNHNGDSADAACGKNTDSVCIVVSGGPVLCQNNNRLLVLRGIARDTCNNDNVLLGGISTSQRWIKEELSSMDVSQDVYSCNPRGCGLNYE